MLTQIPTTPQDSLIDKQLDPIHVFELWANGPCKGLSGAWQSFPMWTSFSSNSLDTNKEIINSNPSFYSWQGARMVWECTWRYEEWACKIIAIYWMIKNDLEYLAYLELINFLKVSQSTITQHKGRFWSLILGHFFLNTANLETKLKYSKSWNNAAKKIIKAGPSGGKKSR